MDALRWDVWKRAGDDERLAAAGKACAWVRAQGICFGRPELVAFGPEGARNTVAVVEDLATGAYFSLVPGGVVRPGLTEETLEVYWDLQRAMLSMWNSNGRTYEQPYSARGWSPDQLTGYRTRRPLAKRLSLVGAPKPSSDTRPAVDIGALFVALQPLTADALGVEADSVPRPLLSFEEAERAAEHLGYAMPSADELEWSTKADGDSLFVWGNQLPEPLDPRLPEMTDEWAWHDAKDAFAANYLSLAETPMASLPSSGIFGLQGAGGQPVWCRGPHGEELVLGGAMPHFPWRNLGEWLWLMPALRVEAATILDHPGAMLRPVLRLPAG